MKQTYLAIFVQVQQVLGEEQPPGVRRGRQGAPALSGHKVNQHIQPQNMSCLRAFLVNFY